MTVETIARADTPQGEIALRLRGDVVELIVNGVFAMDTVDVSSEYALADAAGTPPGRVLVGGLGLGFTACRLLDDGATTVDVVELAEPLLAWAREGVTEQLGSVARDERVQLHHGDIVEFVHSAEAQWNAILLDVDNGPTFLIHEQNRRVYAAEFLRACLDHLAADGRLVVWCESASPDLQATLRCLCEPVDVLSVPVTRQGREFRYVLYRARRPPSPAGAQVRQCPA